jgi:hypothetical protein
VKEAFRMRARIGQRDGAVLGIYSNKFLGNNCRR